MKFTCEIIIDQPLARVIELFDDPDNITKWQKDLVSFEPLSGVAGEVGAKSLLKYDVNGRKIELVETIVTRNLPQEFSGTYDTDGVHNVIVNRFYEVSPTTTRWVAENEFVFESLMFKIMSWIFPRPFRQQSLAIMNQFKDFAEKAG